MMLTKSLRRSYNSHLGADAKYEEKIADYEKVILQLKANVATHREAAKSLQEDNDIICKASEDLKLKLSDSEASKKASKVSCAQAKKKLQISRWNLLIFGQKLMRLSLWEMRMPKFRRSLTL